MRVKLLTVHHLVFLSFKGGCTGSSEYAHVKMPHSWKSHVAAQLFSDFRTSLISLAISFFPLGLIVLFLQMLIADSLFDKL